MKAIVRFRLSQWCFHHRLRFIAYRLQEVNLRNSGADLHPAASVGAGLKLPHTTGIVIGNRAVIGDFVTVGAGAKVLGGISIGDHAQVGSNAVVVKDVPTGTTVGGVPAAKLKNSREQ